jgi:membrane associated rhomboid family serine protease
VAKLRITYNAPVVLTLALVSFLVYLLPGSFEDPKLDPHALRTWFISYPHLGEPFGARSYVGLFTHIFGHANWQHLIGNMMMILLIGPILEERHGSLSLLLMITVCALVSGLVTLMMGGMSIGASGIVFMMIILASTANIRGGDIPLTFIAIAIMYLGGELYNAATAHDNVDHIGHLVGGAVGAMFGFLGGKPKTVAKPIDLKKLPI